MTATVIFLLVVVVIIGVAMLAIFSLTRGRGGSLDQKKYQAAWLKIENSIDMRNAATLSFAIISADKLLDQAMKESGINGDTMGERLKNARGKFAKIDAVWTAHKLRTRIAHEPDANVPAMFMKQALATFKRALRELGAI
jgi:hypothetical protein